MLAVFVDLHHLGRSLRRSPASATAAILTLSLTLGAGAAIFAVVDAVLLTPPPFANPSALVTIGETPVDDPSGAPRAITYATLEAWRDRAQTLATIEAFDPTNLTLTGSGAPERTRATDVTPGFLSLLGVAPVLGRGFAPDDVGRRVVIISDAFWRGKLGADQGVVGREIVLGGQAHTVLGVLPPRFFFGLDDADILRPLPFTSAEASRANLRVRTIARLAPTVSIETLGMALDEISRAATPAQRAIATGLATAVTGRASRTLSLLAGAAGLALLIAFTNLAGLLIVRSLDRGRELAVRTALGASRAEIVRQLLLEATLLVVIGTLFGVLIAWWLTPIVGQELGGLAARVTAVSWRVIGVLSLIAVVSASLCGAMAAFAAGRRNVIEILRRGTTAAPREQWLRRVFVTGVVALAFVLLVSVTLVGRSLMNVLAVNPGFIADDVLTAAVAPPEAKYPTPERLVSFYSTLEDGLSARLGPRTVGIINELPLTGDRGRGVVSLRPSATGPEAVMRMASTAYFDVLRIPLVAGRAFDRRDDASAPPRVIVSQSLAERLLPGETAVGRAVWLSGRDEPAEIIGVVGDVKHRALDDPFLPTLYLSLWQVPSRGNLIAIRQARSDADAIAILRDEAARLDGDLPVYGIGSMPAAIERSPGVVARRVLTTAFSGFALLAVVLAAIGLFGVVAHDVAARRTELALRIALGADPTRLLSATVAQGALMVGGGLAVGGVLSVWATRALGAMVFSTAYVDIVNLGLPGAVLVLTGLVAVLPAALRAARTDPLIALRSE